MLYRTALPLIFVGLWSSAFVTAKVGVQYSTPFAMLLARFAIVSLIFIAATLIARWWRRRKNKNAGADQTDDTITTATILLTAVVGVLLHGVYLGSVFFALSVGLSAGISALVVSLQPLLASFLAIFLFSEKLRLPQVAGIFTGMIGVGFVLWPKMGGGMPMLGLVSVVIGLIAITAGTLLQKHIGGRIKLLAGNVIQTVAVTLFFTVICLTVETPQIDWQMPFILALAWQIILVSGGAYVILMILIQRDSMAATSSLLFLVPTVTAIIAAAGFDEPLSIFSITGFVLTSAGVFMVTRYAAPAAPKLD